MDFLRSRPSAGRWAPTTPVRCLGLAALVLPVLADAEPLTEPLPGLNQPEFVRLLDSRVEAARGNLVARQSWINPAIQLSREEAGNETETSVWLLQRLDLSGTVQPQA